MNRIKFVVDENYNPDDPNPAIVRDLEESQTKPRPVSGATLGETKGGCQG